MLKTLDFLIKDIHVEDFNILLNSVSLLHSKDKQYLAI